jgi:hypothetical protein
MPVQIVHRGIGFRKKNRQWLDGQQILDFRSWILVSIFDFGFSIFDFAFWIGTPARQS